MLALALFIVFYGLMFVAFPLYCEWESRKIGRANNADAE